MVTRENKSSIMYGNLDKLIREGKLEDKKIVLFGLNTTSYSTKSYLEKMGFRIYAYVDNNEKKILEAQEMLTDTLPRYICKETYHKVKKKGEIVVIGKPVDLLSDFDNNIVILIASKYYPTMVQQLMEIGYKENIHIFKTVEFYGIDEILLQDKTLQGLKQLSNEEVRKIQLEITVYLQDLCEKNGLNFYMTGGTLLGAVRHQGYIPWDDDVDITIPMPDYKKLIDLLIEDNNYDVYTVYNDPDNCSCFYMRLIDRKTIMKSWGYPFLTSTGVNVDVFPLIGMPNKADERMIFFNRLRNLNARMTNTFIEYPENPVHIVTYRKQLRDEIINMTELYDFYQSEMGGYILSKYWERDIMPVSIYEGKIKMKFEEFMLTAPIGYDEYLQRIFGEYMKLPSEKEQYVTHNYRVFWKE